MASVLILKTVTADMQAYGGFVWPESGPVEPQRWDPTDTCGNGLHGLLWGCGSARYLSTDRDARWLVFAADEADVVDLGGKVKARRGDVVFVGTRDEAVAYLDANGAADKPVVYAVSTSGDWGTSTSGYRGTSTSGDRGTSTSGDWGIIVCRWWDRAASRYRLTVGYPGEDGIEPNVAYRADHTGRLVKAELA